MSDRSLTGYDNRDANSGQPDEEVFLYDAATEELVCASCNPTGARPMGVLDTGAYPGLPSDPTRTWGETGSEGLLLRSQWLAGVIPGWNESYHDTGAGEVEAPLYESRVLSNSGRLFFDSSDALVPQDVNGQEDVYEYEPPSDTAESPPNDSCTAESAVHGFRSAGCVSLISSGQGDSDSDFVDASANGNDVFFTTEDRLVPADKDSVSDMYDAHVCTSAELCPQESTTTSPPCDSTDSCRAAQSVQPQIFGAPASATFSGAGNPAPTPTPVAKKVAKKAVKCKKGETKTKKGKCLSKKKKRAEAKKSARTNRRAPR